MRNLLTQQGWHSANATVTACDERPVVSMRGRQNRFSYARNYYSVGFRYEAGDRSYDSDFTAYRPYKEGASCLAAALLFLLLRAFH